MPFVSVIQIQDADNPYPIRIESDKLILTDKPNAHLRLPIVGKVTVQLQANAAPLLSATKKLQVNSSWVKTTRLNPGDTLHFNDSLQLVYLGVNHTGELHFTLHGCLSLNTDIPKSAAKKTKLFYPSLTLLMLLLISLPAWVPNLAETPAKDRHIELGSSATSASLALERWLSSGTLHPAHETTSQSCADCHVQHISPVPNESCLSCHTMERHFSREMTGNHPLCVTCHQEHNEPTNLINPDTRLCTQCHNNMAVVDSVLTKGSEHTLTAFRHFDGEHPEFRPTSPSPQIRFNHKSHLSEHLLDNQTALTCTDCHQPDGAKHKPIDFDHHCGQCHTLNIEESSSKFQWVHGELAAIVAQLVDQKVGNADIEALSVINSKTCRNCHRANLRKIDTDEFSEEQKKWRLQIPSLNVHFSHKRHEGRLACRDCHTAEKSEDSSDILLPVKAQCTSCHNRNAAQPLQQCASCHQFHRVDWQTVKMNNGLKMHISQ